jgi:VWFA-related protein
VAGTPFRATTEQVVVDVTVVDDKGSPVVGLAPADFEVTVEGTPRKVVTAAYTDYGADANATRAAGMRPDEDGFVTNQGLSTPRLLLFAIDEAHVRPLAAKAIIDTAAGMLDALAPNDLIAVARLPRLTQGQDFTTDHAAVRAALAKATGRGQPFTTPMFGLSLGVAVEYLRNLGPMRQEIVTSVCSSRGAFEIRRPLDTGARTEVQKCVAEISSETRALVDDFILTAKDTAYGLERLMETLGKLPGKKRVVLFSEGLYLGDDIRLLARAEELAARAQASITVIKPETVLNEASAAGPAIPNDPTASLLDRGLDDLAGATGGTLSKVVGTGKPIFDRIARELSGSYTIAFTPEPADRDGKRHQVKVRVARPGVTVRARREFVIDDKRPLQDPENRLKALLASTVPETGVPVRASALTSPVTGGKVRAFVQSIVGAEGAKETDALGAAAIIDGSGTVVASFGLEPARLNAGDPRAGLVLGGARDVDPGDYRLRVAVVLPDGRAGSLETALVAKPRQAGDVSLSDLLVGLRPPAGQAFRPVPLPVVDRELVMAIELASGDPDTTAGTEVHFEIAPSTDGDALVEQAVEVPDGRKVATAAASIELTLPPGTYVARARITPPGADPVLLSKRFVVVAGSGEASTIGPRIDRAALPPPLVTPFDRTKALSPDAIAPFLDHVAAAFPQGRAGDALLAKARTGQFDVPASPPGGAAEHVAYALVRGLATLRDHPGQECVSAFNDLIDRAGGFIGFALFQGDCYAASGHDRDAVAAWQMALLGNVGLPVIYEQLVDGYLRLADGAQALQTLAEGDLVWSDRAGFDRRRGLALALLDRHEEALPLLEAAAAAAPSADRDLLFSVLRSMYAGRRSGWLQAGPDVLKRFDGYLERYAAAQGPQLAVAREWKKAFEK